MVVIVIFSGLLPSDLVVCGRSRRAPSRGATIAPLRLPISCRPDPFQGLAELTCTQRSCQFPPAEHTADPPDLKTSERQVFPVQVLHHRLSAHRSAPSPMVMLTIVFQAIALRVLGTGGKEQAVSGR